VGSIETLLDDSRRLAEVAGSSGVDVTLHVYDDMPHVWQMSYPAFPEAVEAVEELAAFVRRHTS
jgi:acetyl esterase/lipase